MSINNLKVGLSSYKLVQFLKTYVNPQGKEIPITIRSLIAQRWLSYEYKNERNDVFIDRYERSNLVKDCKIF